MATSMGTSVSDTSAEIPFCDACRKIDHKDTEAHYLCEICNHYLCDRCLEHHSRTLETRGHKVVQPRDVKYEESDFQVSGCLTNTRPITESEDASSDISESEENPVLTEEKSRHVYREATFLRGLDVSSQNDHVACAINGIAFFLDKIIVTDTDNTKLKVFSSSYDFLFEHKCDLRPFDIDKVDERSVLVSFPHGNLTLYSVGNDDLKEQKIIKNAVRCFGVCFYDEKIYCVVKGEFDSKTVSEIDVYTLDGTLRKKIEFLSDGGIDFSNLLYITVNKNTGILYATDWDNGIVALTTKGEVLTQMSPTEMEHPTGIATDDNGQIYVCGCASFNLLQISADGQKTIEILSRNIRCRMVQCVEVYGSKLFLACRGSSNISIYELS